MPTSWANTELENQEISLEHAKIYVISDVHLGDGTRSDAFLQKRDQLRALLRKIAEEKAHLVIAGDLVDFHQGWSIDRIITANAVLFRELSDLAKESGVTYIWSAQDYDLSYFVELFSFVACSEVVIPSNNITPKIRIQQGHLYDPRIGKELHTTPKIQKMVHIVERFLGTWLRSPLEYFPTVENRMALWMVHKIALVQRWCAHNNIATTSTQSVGNWLLAIAQGQIGNNYQVFSHVQDTIHNLDADVLVTGHSHVPGVVKLGEKTYINTGSWTFDASQYLVIDREQGTLELWDWNRKQRIQNEEYTHLQSDHTDADSLDNRLLHLDFLGWWKENYLGWLKFRFDT